MMMKKLITLCLFAIAITFSTQNLSAQTTKDINAAASTKAKEVQKVTKLHKNQLEDVYRAYQIFEKSYQALDSANEKHRQEIKKLNLELDETLKTILNDEQFERYLATFRSN